LAEFHTTLIEYKAFLEEDPIVKAHLDTLYDDLLEKNLCRIIEPFSRVQVTVIQDLSILGLIQMDKIQFIIIL
jgi:26S proteasome regulatory subunit N6